jgi:histidinol-phosphate aminotransferase
MTDSLDFIRPHIREFPPYEPILPFDVLSDELGIPVSKLVKLDANENPYGPLPIVKEALAKLDTFHVYPDPESRQIRRLLAEYHQISEKQIVMGAGADELIDLIMRIVINPGDKIINCPPTFGMYAFDGALNQAEVISVPRNTDFSLDMPLLLEAVERTQPKLMFIASPNNPDGGVLSAQEFEQLFNLPLLLVVDEAYTQFSEVDSSFIDKVEDHQNLIVLRTFSKWAGLAGLRIGYGIFPTPFVPMLMKAKQPYNVSAAAEGAAVVTMQHIEQSHDRIQKIIAERENLYTMLEDVPWLKPYPSQANFVLCRVEGKSALAVKQVLRSQGILIRYFNKPGLDDHIRISVGTPEQNEKLLTALKGIR